jgi:O-antigen/teichoic acid export membrane protein
LSKNKEVLKNIGLSIIYKPIGILISLALVPLTIKYLGNTSYGLWATILSIISWINYFDIGIGNGLRNHLAREITLKNYKESREYIMTAYGSVAFISIIILLTLTVLFKIFNWNSIFNIDSYTNQELFFIMLVNLVFIVMNFVLKIVATIYYSLQKSSTVGLIQILNQLFNLIGIYSLYRMEYANSLLGISVVYGLGMVLSNIIFTLILFIKNRELIPKFKDFKYDKVKSLSGLGIKFFIIQIAAMIIFTTDNMIITKLLGPEEVTPYNITFKVFSIIIMLHGIIITPLWSAITKAFAEKDVEWLKRVLKRLNQLNVLIIIAILVLNSLFSFIIKVWIGDNVLIPKLMVYMFSLYTILIVFCNNHAYYFNGLGEIDFQLRIAIIQGIVNIPISIFFAKYLEMGSVGVILGTNITLLLAAATFPFRLNVLLKNMEIREKI